MQRGRHLLMAEPVKLFMRWKLDVKPHMLDAKTCGSVPSSISAAWATYRWEP